MSLVDLPSELKVAILQSDAAGLDRKSLFNVSCTCKSLRNFLAPSLFRELRFSSDPVSAESARAAAKAYPDCVRSLKFVGIDTYFSDDDDGSSPSEGQVGQVCGTDEEAERLPSDDSSSDYDPDLDDPDLHDSGSEASESPEDDGSDLDASDGSEYYAYESGSDCPSEDEDELIELELERRKNMPFRRRPLQKVHFEWEDEVTQRVDAMRRWNQRQEQVLCAAARQLLSGLHTPNATRLSLDFGHRMKPNDDEERRIVLIDPNFAEEGIYYESPSMVRSAESKYILRARIAAIWDSSEMNTKVRELNVHHMMPLRATSFESSSFQAWLGTLEALSISMGPKAKSLILSDVEKPIYMFIERMNRLFFAHSPAVKSLSFRAHALMNVGNSSRPVTALWRFTPRPSIQLPLEPSHMPQLRYLYLQNIVICSKLTAYLVGHSETLETLEMINCWAPSVEAYESDRIEWLDLFNSYAESEPVLRRLIIRPLCQVAVPVGLERPPPVQWRAADAIVSIPDDESAWPVKFEQDLDWYERVELHFPYGRRYWDGSGPECFSMYSIRAEWHFGDKEAYYRLVKILKSNLARHRDREN